MSWRAVVHARIYAADAGSCPDPPRILERRERGEVSIEGDAGGIVVSCTWSRTTRRCAY